MQSIEADQAEFTTAMTTPAAYGEKPLPRRAGSRGMLPSTWLGRSVRLAYTDVHGGGVETSGILLDWTAFGAAFGLGGGKVLVSWDRLAMLELVND